jgi:hypothetical protein
MREIGFEDLIGRVFGEVVQQPADRGGGKALGHDVLAVMACRKAPVRRLAQRIDEVDDALDLWLIIPFRPLTAFVRAFGRFLYAVQQFLFPGSMVVVTSRSAT